VRQTVSSPTIALPGRSALLWISRARGLFTGLGYAVTLTVILVAAWTLRAYLGNIGTAAATTPLRNALTNIGESAWVILPGALMIVVGVNLAPHAGVRRLVWLVCPALLTVLWPRLTGHGLQWNAAGLAAFLESLLAAALVLSVCAYHSHIQGAADMMLRTQIDHATLDAELKRAHLQLLRAQIEPHFLFNTLSVVRTLARIDRAGTVEMLDNLMRYFAAALPRLRQDEAPLAEEMQLIDAYLGIYRVRMGARLGYEVALPKNLADIRVPTMMLLTLVENALKHGVNPVVEGGFIRVSATRERAALLLKVADSGRGMSARHGHGMGLANVRQRLIMLYGDAAVLSLAHAEPRGVVATISIPLR
jgi:signal transduction histidine kinase